MKNLVLREEHLISHVKVDNLTCNTFIEVKESNNAIQNKSVPNIDFWATMLLYEVLHLPKCKHFCHVHVQKNRKGPPH